MVNGVGCLIWCCCLLVLGCVTCGFGFLCWLIAVVLIWFDFWVMLGFGFVLCGVLLVSVLDCGFAGDFVGFVDWWFAVCLLWADCYWYVCLWFYWWCVRCFGLVVRFWVYFGLYFGLVLWFCGFVVLWICGFVVCGLWFWLRRDAWGWCGTEFLWRLVFWEFSLRRVFRKFEWVFCFEFGFCLIRWWACQFVCFWRFGFEVDCGGFTVLS